MGKGKSKVFSVLIHCAMKKYRDSGGKALTLTLDGSEWSASWCGNLNSQGRASGNQSIGGWVDPRAILCVAANRKIPTSRSGYPTHSLVLLLTVLSKIH
jgi:hypothetical protein